MFINHHGLEWAGLLHSAFIHLMSRGWGHHLFPSFRPFLPWGSKRKFESGDEVKEEQLFRLSNETHLGASLVVQWLRIRLPMQRTWV